MSYYWPDIQTSEDADKACKTGAGMAFFIAIVTGLVAWLQSTGKINIFPGLDQKAFLDAGIFAVIGFGLTRRSRIAAVAGLLLFVAERVFMIKSYGIKFSHVVSLIILGSGFVSGVRGSFVWHELLTAEKAAEKASGAEEEVKPASKVKKIISWVIVISLLAAAGVAGFRYWQSQLQSHTPHAEVSDSAVSSLSRDKTSVLPSKSFPSQGNSIPVAGSRSFRLKTGEVISGKVVQDDEVFYTVETSGGKQKIVIKEDVVSEE